MKTKWVLLLTVLLALLLTMTVSAADDPAVYVTIADENGDLAVAMESVDVTDTDADGVLTIHDALTVVHDRYDKEYLAEQSAYGLSMTTLWGVSNGGSYGYYLNDQAAMSLADPIKDGDRVTAFVYTDLETWSDAYSWFEDVEIDDDTLTLTLMAFTGYDENWSPIAQPVADATIVIDSQPTTYTTDVNGQVTLPLTDDMAVISAQSDDLTLVPPVYRVAKETVESTASAVVTTTATTSSTADNTVDNTALIVVVCVVGGAAVLLIATVIVVKKLKK